jgi:DNA invertase Pin-like site-specific DNA recombinase
MLVGYARVSTSDQSFHLQLDALKASGCERIFQDAASGPTAQRQGLNDAMAKLHGREEGRMTRTPTIAD